MKPKRGDDGGVPRPEPAVAGRSDGAGRDRGDRPRTFQKPPQVAAPPPGDRPLKTLERIISKAGLGSRTEARRWIAGGRVEVNGGIVRDPDQWIDLERDRVRFDGSDIVKAAPVHLMLHKPVGYLTTYNDPRGRATIYDLLQKQEQYLFPVGRLDRDTSGLLLLTNDTQFTERLTNPDFKVPKTYIVTAAPALSETSLESLRSEVELRDGMTRPALVTRIADRNDQTEFQIVITEGRNRQVRRMVEAVGSEVVSLQRVAIGDLVLGDLTSGATRALTAEEVARFDSAGGR